MPVMRQYELVEKVRSYDPKVDEDLLNRAYVFTMKAHGSQQRHSGDPYWSHPIEVAGILTDLKLDGDTIATAILHDTIEDTVATKGEIESLFGPGVAQMVDGVTKLSQIEIPETSSRQAENFRKFILAMSKDIRILLVKLADRLHNMRTLQYHPKETSRRRIAQETLDIYAPLAERIGMYEIKDELSSLSFQYLYPKAEASIKARLGLLREKGDGLVNDVVHTLEHRLSEMGIAAQVMGREKKPYSIYRKLQEKRIQLEELVDVVAFRVLVDTVPQCYEVLGLVHDTWKCTPGRFKDYISQPKPNGYRSLHTAVFGPGRRPIEVQIRTHDMHAIAENGVAAHWRYKTGMMQPDSEPTYPWLRDLVEISEAAINAEEFLENTKLAMFDDQVFCFTPKGRLVMLPRGATAIDFAYSVHTDVGNTCVGAKVNGHIVPLRKSLRNGDQVEILRSSAQKPAPVWLSFAKTPKARAAVRRALRQKDREDYMALGQSLVDHALDKLGLEAGPKAWDRVSGLYDVDEKDDILAKIGEGSLSEKTIILDLFPHLRDDNASTEVLPEPVRTAAALPIVGSSDDMALRLGECCHPLPGDRLVGIRLMGSGVVAHRIDCAALEAFSSVPERWLDLQWSKAALENTATAYEGRLALTLHNDPGALAQVANTMAQAGGNVVNLRILDRDHKMYTMIVDIGVRSLQHLTDILIALSGLSVVNSAERAQA
ncbi:MAG: bifunctional (p)ppGpp synthetase/guanosine-3',5'-bis(diphosphate) 3'-pyrophosphohydrolase [Pseudomonadota bacterium]